MKLLRHLDRQLVIFLELHTIIEFRAGVLYTRSIVVPILADLPSPFFFETSLTPLEAINALFRFFDQIDCWRLCTMG